MTAPIAAHSFARSPADAPPLPPVQGEVIEVADVQQLYHAVDRLKSNTSIVLKAGEYQLDKPIHLHRPLKNVSIRGATGRYEDVVVRGAGMNNQNVWHGVIVEQVDGLLIADLTIGWVGYHPITIGGRSQNVRVYHCRLVDAGEQFIKANSNRRRSPGQDANRGVKNGVVEYCVLEYAKMGPPNGYTNGVDVHGGENWIIRHNLFRNIRTPRGAKYRAVPAVLMWNGSKHTLCEGNTFVHCDRAIALGLVNRKEHLDHEGGVIRNNFIYASKNKVPHLDAGISVSSPGAKVLHNTILHNGGYPDAIEARWATTKHVQVAGNLTDGRIIARNGSSITATGNVTHADSSMFKNATEGDLHLLSKRSVQPLSAPTSKNCPRDWDDEKRPTADAFPGADQP